MHLKVMHNMLNGFTIVFILFTHYSQPSQGLREEFFVKFTNNDRTTLKPQIIRANHKIHYEPNQEVEMLCEQHINNQNSSLEWLDNDGFFTGKIEKFNHNKIKVILIPDSSEIDLELTCRAYRPSQKDITIKLIKNQSQSKKSNSTTQIIKKIPKGIAYQHQANCTAQVRYTDNTYKKVPQTQTVIENFVETDNGTIIKCVQYQNITKKGDPVTFQRFISITYLYLESNTITERSDTNGTILTQSNIVDGYPKATILWAVLGSIAVVLLIAGVMLYFKKKHVTVADEVVYAEIEDRPPQLPPPRQLAPQPPYASVVGTLVPKEMQTSQPKPDEHLYSTLNLIIN